MFSGRTTLVLGLIAGSVARLVQLATSIGSVDSYFWTKHVELVEKHGLFKAYLAAKVLNHPPFALEIALWTGRAGRQLGLQLFDSFRLLQCIADVVTALALVRLARKLPHQPAVFAGLAFFLSPAVIFVSAFHCNSDPLMMMFLVLAIVAVVEERPLAAGVLAGAAVGIKVIALAALPLLFLGCRGKKGRALFAAAAAIAGAVIFVPAIVASGMVVVRNIFGYTGWRGGWGLPLIADLLGFTSGFVTPLLVASLLALWGAETWRTWNRGTMEPQRVAQLTGLAYLLVLFFASGFLPHYILWFLPFLALMYARRTALALHALMSVFLFWLYTSWAGEWPWVYAPGGNHAPYVAIFGMLVWAAIGAAALMTIRTLYPKRAR